MNKSVTSVLFDLDGTLVDPAGAITSGISYAVTSHGLPEPGDEALQALIGPPLQVGLRTLHGVTDQNIESIIARYRARYAEVGMSQSRVYPGIRPLLAALRHHGVYTAVTTAKPVDIARALLRRQGLESLFDAVHGNPGEYSPQGSSKTHIVAAALREADLDPQGSVVVGDRGYDLDAAAENGVDSIGVQWGFARPGELDAADHRAATAKDLTVLLLGAAANDINFEEAVQEGTR